VPDACAVAGMYSEWFSYGKGVNNYLAVPDLPFDPRAIEFELPGGYILNGELGAVHPFRNHADPTFRAAIAEDVTHAYYDGNKVLHPWQGESIPRYTGFHSDGKYTWVKAPRFQGRPMQVGPLAQVLIGYAQKHPLTRKCTDAALDRISSAAGRRIGISDLQSTMGRHVARCIRTAMLADLAQKHWQMLVQNIGQGDLATFNPPEFPSGDIQGVGIHEAPRGALSHWVVVNGGRIKNYQAVVPSTWNASPRDAAGNRGPYEAALLKNPIANPEQPLEVLRTVHSFDPCMACACHTFHPGGRPIAQVKVL
jgi:hydrogenase large subunit